MKERLAILPPIVFTFFIGFIGYFTFQTLSSPGAISVAAETPSPVISSTITTPTITSTLTLTPTQTPPPTFTATLTPTMTQTSTPTLAVTPTTITPPTSTPTSTPTATLIFTTTSTPTLTSTTTVTSTSPLTATKPVTMIVDINLKVRERPDLASNVDVVAWLPPNTEVVILGRNEEEPIWLNILAPNGREGWIRESAVKPEEQEITVADLAVVPTPALLPAPPPIPIPLDDPAPQGEIVLLSPRSAEEEFFADVEFSWRWEGDDLPPDYGFEVRIWREGEEIYGANDPANGVQRENDRYSLTLDVTSAPGVGGREGVYLWTVRLIPLGADIDHPPIEAEPGKFFFNK